MGIHLISGRTFRSSDVEDLPKVVVVSETFARDYFGMESAIGNVLVEGWVIIRRLIWKSSEL